MTKNSFILLLLLITVSRLHAHSVHQSTAEVEYNATSKKLEISLTVFVSDLELALVRQVEREISFAKTPVAELDQQIQRYLAKTFAVSDANSKPVPLLWVGRELDAATQASSDPTVTLYFEAPLPERLKCCTLLDSAFCDFFKDQVNLVHLISGPQNVELRFTRDETKRALAFGK